MEDIMSLETLISVIVPVYNVEKYLSKCIDSILNQTYQNLEIILVDDGSTDSSGYICDEYAKKDHRIIVIHKINGGLSDARNAGILSSNGDYISFIDSDDYIEKETYTTLCKMIKDKNVSICAMLMKQVNEVGTILGENSNATCGLYQSKDFIVSLLQYKGSASVCDKLFSKDFFTDNKFQTGVLNEDFVFMVESLVTKDVSIYVSDYVGYNYLKRQGSTTTSGFSKTIVDLIYNASKAEEIIMDTYPDLKLEIKRFILFQIRTFMLLIPKEKMNDDFEPYVFTMNLFDENKKYLFSANIDIVSKIFLMMLNISPGLAKTALNFLQKNIFKDRIQS